VVFLYLYLGATVDYWGCTWIMIGVVAAMRVHLSDLAAAQAPAPAWRSNAGPAVTGAVAA
jgi:hypothetical protein